MTVRQLGGRKATRRSAEPAAAVRPADPARRRQHQIALGDPPERLRDRPAPPRQHLLRERAGRRTVRRPRSRSARRRRRRRCSTSRSSGPVYAVSGSGGLPRLAFILNGQVDADPAGRNDIGQGRAPADDGPGRPRRADRPLPPDRLRRQDGLPGQHPRPLRRTRRSSRSTTPPRTARPARETVKVKTACGKSQARQAPPR